MVDSDDQPVGTPLVERLTTTLKRYEQILHAAGYVIYETDERGHFTDVSEPAPQLTGYSSDELIGKHFTELIVPDWKERVQVFYEQQFRDAVPETVLEFPIVTQSGEGKWVEQTVMLVTAEGGPPQFRALVHDITERKRTEEALRASEHFAQQIANTAPDFVYVYDLADQRSIYSNREIGRALGYAEQELGDVGTVLNPRLVHPDDLPRVAGHFKRFSSARDDDVLEIEFRVKLASGEWWWLKSRETVFRRSADGVVRQVLGVAQNVTDLKQAAESLQKRIEELTTLRRVDIELAERLNVDYVLTLALDAAVRLSRANAGYIGLIEEGHLRVATAVGAYDTAQIAEAANQGRGIVARAIRQQRSERVADVQSDPDYILGIPGMRANIVIPLTSHDQVIGVINLETSDPRRFTPEVFQFVEILATRIAAAVDNAWLHAKTEQQLEELQRLYDRVSKLEQLKTDMIRIASHDLRNPLGTVTGGLEMLQADLSDQFGLKENEYIGMIDRAAQRMLKIISDILSLERIEETAEHAVLETFNLCETVERAFQEHQSQAEQRSLRFTLELPADPLHVAGDPAQIHEAVVNLITNAIKYTPEGGSIGVALKADGERAQYTVADTGFGIPEAQQARLFEPFYRVSTRETRKVEGTGLGLHLVKNIVERHGGKMVFHSVYGEGSTFGFTLPLVEDSGE